MHDCDGAANRAQLSSDKGFSYFPVGTRRGETLTYVLVETAALG